MTPPFFTVLMPAFNARDHIARAIRDLLRQSYRDFEILVVDDGSTDGTGDVVRSFRDDQIRLLELPVNMGLVAALNAGLAESRGHWIARQDADDRCRPRRLLHMRELIHSSPEGVLFYSRARLIDGRGLWRGTMSPPLTSGELRWDLSFRNAVPHTSAVFSREVVSEIGGYRGDNVTADFDLWSRLLRSGTAAGHPGMLVSYRIHSGSIMGRENAAPVSSTTEGLRGILTGNLREWLGATPEVSSRVAAAWLAPGSIPWDEYFTATEDLASHHRGIPPAVIAEEDLGLLHRAAGVSRDCAKGFLAAMKRHHPGRYRRMPAFRTLAARMTKGI